MSIDDCEEYALSTALSQVRADSREVWKLKDYIAVVQILSPHVGHLTLGEQESLIMLRNIANSAFTEYNPSRH